MFGTCQISSQVRSDKYGGASLCCAQRRFRFQDTNLTVPTPHNWGDHITHEVCWSTLHAGEPHVQFGRRTEASASRRASSDPTIPKRLQKKNTQVQSTSFWPYLLQQFKIGGTDGIRTRDLLRDRQVLD